MPVALGLIFGLLFLSLRNVKNALLIFTGVPLALTGGLSRCGPRAAVLDLGGVGFIALSGVAVLNGLVMVTFIENLRDRGRARSTRRSTRLAWRGCGRC